MKIPAIRAHIGDWVYYIATMRFKDVSKYVKRVDNELHKSDLLKQMLQRSITNNYKSIAHYIETQEERFFNALVLAVYDGVPTWHEVRLEYDDGSEFYNLGVLELSGDEKFSLLMGNIELRGLKKSLVNPKGMMMNKSQSFLLDIRRMMQACNAQEDFLVRLIDMLNPYLCVIL